MKSVEAILKKHGIKVTSKSPDRKKKSPNNESRDKFKDFCNHYGYKSVGRNNAFIFNGKIYGFSTSKNNYPECRQFSEHYSGFVCIMPCDTMKWVHSSSVHLGACTRVGPDGVKYFNATEVIKP